MTARTGSHKSMIGGCPAPAALAVCVAALASALAGCTGPSARLDFPRAALAQSAGSRSYDLTGDGRADFTLRAEEGRLNVLEYDDDGDGRPDRAYRLSDYDPDRVPHLIILVDSLPFAQTLDRYERAGWTWFDEPARVIPPFPTMSALIFSRMLGAPPTGGAINQYYDANAGRRVNRIWQRFTGDPNPWERRLHYRIGYFGNGNSFLQPRSWFAAELAMAKRAFDKSPDRVTVVYLASAAGMLSQHGRQGLDECLDGIEQLSLQVLHERRGAVKISIVSDHGHNLEPGRRIDAPAMLERAGFQPVSRLRDGEDHLDDVVVEIDGMVNYFGVHCRRSEKVADALISNHEIELVMWQEGDRVLVRSSVGTAAVEFRNRPRGGRAFRYGPIEGPGGADVLGYGPVIHEMRQAGDLDPDGFASAGAWLARTADHPWPDAPYRLWEAFHGLMVSTPTVMAVTAPGYYAGAASFDWWIDMASTHGGLDQRDSAAVLLTMTGRAPPQIRTGDVLRTIEPEFDPDRLRRK